MTELVDGTWVCIQGLESRPDLNGTVGVIRSRSQNGESTSQCPKFTKSEIINGALFHTELPA